MEQCRELIVVLCPTWSEEEQKNILWQLGKCENCNLLFFCAGLFVSLGLESLMVAWQLLIFNHLHVYFQLKHAVGITTKRSFI